MKTRLAFVAKMEVMQSVKTRIWDYHSQTAYPPNLDPEDNMECRITLSEVSSDIMMTARVIRAQAMAKKEAERSISRAIVRANRW